MVPPPITVNVTYDEETNTLTASPSLRTLQNPDDWVLWRFDPNSTPPPENASLLIRFNQPLGPFQVVRGVGTQTLIAKGNKGDASPVSYTYFLYLLLDPDDPEQLVKSGSLTIENENSVVNLSPWLHVTLDGDELHVDPDPIILHEGDVTYLKVSDVPEDHIVGFEFPADNSAAGPFPTYFVTRQNATETQRLASARFGSAEIGEIPYGVRVWDANGTLVASKDPIIDGLGKPPGT